MEPPDLQTQLVSTLSLPYFAERGPSSSFFFDDNLVKASIAASLERARLRSLQFAPKVGSPLAKRVFVMPDMTPDNGEDE